MSIQRRNQLTNFLNECRKEYYSKDRSPISDKSYDAMFDELKELEKKYGALSNSPTQNVGYEAVDELKKVKHPSKMASLDKTKEVDKLLVFLNSRVGLLSWKLDGLTVVLTYEDGKLISAVTRGNGEIGEDVLHNAKTFKNLPLTIPYKERLVLRGEAVISYKQFEKINKTLEQPFKNPRNLASATVRALDSRTCADREVEWLCFEVVEGFEEINSKNVKFTKLIDMGFPVVETRIVDSSNLITTHEGMTMVSEGYKYPVDGLVLTYDNISYSKELGSTAHHPLHSIAFKWEDEVYETTLRDVEWSPTRMSINPVAIFDMVEIDGTEVTRASLHNVSYIEDLQLGIGDDITVYKANQIIPQIDKNLTRKGGLEIPKHCPCCGAPTLIRTDNETNTKVLICINDDCLAKKVSIFSNFVSRNHMNIVGLSEATLEKMLTVGIIKEFADIYTLADKEDDVLTKVEGFGKKSFQKLIKAIDKSREVESANVLAALGIEKVGLSVARDVCKEFTLEQIINETNDYSMIDGIGEVVNSNLNMYMAENKDMVLRLLAQLNVKEPEKVDISNSPIAGKNFVVTGSVAIYKNRKELQAEIERLGGKVVGSVSKNTDYLINNDKESTSGKNKKAQELGVPILSEEDFVKMIQ